MDSLFQIAKQMYPNASDDEINQSLQQIRSQAPDASDDEIIQAASKIQAAQKDGTWYKQLVRENVKQKYGMGEYSPEARQKLVDGVQASGSPIAAAFAGFGAGLAGRDVGSAFKGAMDYSQQGAKDKLAAFDQARKTKQEDFDFDQKLTKAEREDKAYADANDPQSELSKSYQDAAIAAGLDEASARKLNAETLKTRLPFLEKRAEQDFRQKEADRAQANKDRDYNLDQQKYKDSRSDAVLDREMKQKEFDLRAKAQATNDVNEKRRLELQADELKLKRETTLNAQNGGKMTEGQLGSAGFADRIAEAEKDFAELEKSGYDRSEISSGLGSMLPNIMKSKESQRQEQAERNFINAVLRKESGAVISDSEFKSAEKQYFPRAGDSPEVVAQKKRNRATVLESMKRSAGPGYKGSQSSSGSKEESKPKTEKKQY